MNVNDEFDFDIYAVGMDSDTVNQDFDDIDFFGDHIVKDDAEESDILFE